MCEKVEKFKMEDFSNTTCSIMLHAYCVYLSHYKAEINYRFCYHCL